MNANIPLNTDAQKKADSRRKRKAILAGGVVLGLGAAVTLAAWSDDVFADGLFNTGGVFLLEGSEQAYGATAFAPAQTETDAISLVFSADASTALTPGDTAYAPFSIRLTSASTLDGTLDNVTANATGAMAGALQYTITRDASECAAGGNNGTAWVTGESVNGGEFTPAAPIDLTADEAGAPGEVVQLCVAVTFPDTPDAKNEVGDTSADTRVVWDFYGEQNS